MAISESTVKNLWEKMSKIYGYKWVSSFGEADDGTWLTGLRELTPELLAVGLHACIKRTDPWPPSLPEFRALCLGIPSEAILLQQAIKFGGGTLGDRIRGRIGQWDLDHDNEYVLLQKAKAVYPQVMDEMQNVLIVEAIENQQKQKQIGTQ